MKNFDKKSATALAKKLEAVMVEFAKENDMTVVNRGGKYDSYTFSPKFEFTLATTEAVQEINAELQNTLKSFGLKSKSKLGDKVLTDYKPRNHKYPFIYIMNNKSYKCSYEQAKHMFG